ncbi:MAG: hypothetical protein GY827_09690 [Cytophagales bacterium]|nr:hypothetical protein [Cytophagales bacterium]
MDRNNKYQCVSCAFYDELEALATYYKTVNLTYRDENEQEVKVQTQFKNFKTVDGAEFVILSNDHLIRLDKILEVEEV